MSTAKDKNGNTPLHHHANSLVDSSVAVVKALLHAGASLTATDAKGISAIDRAPADWHDALRQCARGGSVDALLESILGARAHVGLVGVDGQRNTVVGR